MDASVNDGENQKEIRKNFALLVESAAENYALSAMILDGLMTISGSNRADASSLISRYQPRANSSIVKALIWQFIYDATKAYRICERTAQHLHISRDRRKDFLKKFRPLQAVRNISDHTFDPTGNPRKKNIKASTQEHNLQGLTMGVDQTSMIIVSGKILVGDIDIAILGKEVLFLVPEAGFMALANWETQQGR